ncbi:MAG: hypothetical protein GY796_12390 [Chloroflexi bacterium]|nr:hypothetical protein [Chloroflexota bacterium]
MINIGRKINYRVILYIIAGLAGAATIAGFAGQLWWVFDVTIHFRVQLLLIISFSALYFAIKRERLYFVISAGCVLLNLSIILPLYLSPALTHNNAEPVRGLLINVQEQQESVDPILELIQSLDPDLILFVETTESWVEQMASLEQTYLYSHLEPRYSGAGLALFSRLPLTKATVWGSFPQFRPAIMAQVLVDGEPVTVIAVHPYPPLRHESWRTRNQQLAEVANFVAAQNEPVIVIGDLNTTPWSPIFRNFLEEAGLQDGRRGFGVKPTWPTHLPFMRIPLDHFLATEEISVQNFSLGPDVGSDHFPVIVDFVIVTGGE